MADDTRLTPDPDLAADRAAGGLTAADLAHLRRCVELAAEALAAGDEPFGSVLVSATGTVLAEDRNREGGGDQTRHPEFDLARWAGEHLPQDERAGCTVYTSGEHCAMCSAAHAQVGLGRIVIACTGRQLDTWRTGWGARPGVLRPLAINDVAPGIEVLGPVPELYPDLLALHEQAYRRDA